VHLVCVREHHQHGRERAMILPPFLTLAWRWTQSDELVPAWRQHNNNTYGSVYVERPETGDTDSDRSAVCLFSGGQPSTCMYSTMGSRHRICISNRRCVWMWGWGAASERWQRAAISNWSVITDWSLWAASMNWSDGFFADEFLFAGHYIGCRRRVPRRTAHVMEIVCRVVGVVAGWRFGR
jgi:hypothetical protein